MGADLITAVLVCRTGTALDFDAAHAVIDGMVMEDFDPYMTDLLGISDVEEGKEQEWLRDMAHEAFIEVQAMVENGARCLNVYENLLGAGFDLYVVGDRTWGDTPDGYDAFVYVACCRRAAEAVGFMSDMSGWHECVCK